MVLKLSMAKNTYLDIEAPGWAKVKCLRKQTFREGKSRSDTDSDMFIPTRSISFSMKD